MMSAKTSDAALSASYAKIVDALMIATESRPHQRWLITAARSGDGTTTTALGIARDLATRNSKAVLVDANFQNPTITRHLDDPSAPGLVEAITQGQATDAVCHSSHRMGGFAVIGTGAGEATPLELFARPRAAELLEELSGQFDVVVIDTASLAEGLGALSLTPHVDGCVLTVRAATRT